MPQPRPLSRSLAPLPGESLPGFLLRLSCRLNQPPARIAELTGIAPDGRSGASLPVTLLAGIPEPARRTFTFMTRLGAGRAAQLGMSAWRERYAPLVIAGPDHAGAGYRRLNGELVLAPVTRYCPDCLAGDGSAIQESFGGPWLKTWHLPVVFACTAHQRLLEHLCPECARPVRAPRPGTQFSLLPAVRAAALHPAQCRTELAPARGRHTLPGSTRPGAGGRQPQGWPRSRTRSWAFSTPAAPPAR
jgi:TniQ